MMSNTIQFWKAGCTYKLLLVGVGMLFFSHYTLSGQQFSAFSTAEEQSSYINPASINYRFDGDKYRWRFGATYRTQWIGSKLGPQTYLVSVEHNRPSRFKSLNVDNIYLLTGGDLMRDRLGPTTTSSAMLRLGVMILEPKKKLYSCNFGFSGAIRAGFRQHRILADQITFIDPNDVVTQRAFQTSKFAIDAGLYFFQNLPQFLRTRKSVLIIGASGHQLGERETIDIRVEAEEYKLQRIPHWNVYGTWLNQFDSGQYLYFSTWIKHVRGAPLSIMCNLKYPVFRLFWMSAGGGTSSRIGAPEAPFSFQSAFGFIIPQSLDNEKPIELSFSFEYPFRVLGPNFGPNLEVNLNYLIDPYPYRD
jgi:hypothetical protein